MAATRVSAIFQKADLIEMRLCMLMNNTSQRSFIRNFFRGVSRLGDGIFWYSLAAIIPYLHGDKGFLQSAHVLLTGLCVLALYKYLKKRLVRERPFISFENIQQAAPALDRYSFPSGHTMHAFSFAIMFSYYLPAASSLVWGFTSLVAMSRVVLGLHYPTDVAAGAMLGSSMAILSLLLVTTL